MANKIFRVNNTNKNTFKNNGNIIFNYNATYSSNTITGLINPRDMEALSNRLFICEAGATVKSGNILKGILIKNFQNPTIDIGYLNTYGSDSLNASNAPTGLALDFNINTNEYFFYITTLNTVAKWQITDTTTWACTKIASFNTGNGDSFHDVTINKDKGLLYVSGYNTLNMYYLDSNTLLQKYTLNNLGYTYSLISTFFIIDDIFYFFITDWGNYQIKIYKMNNDGTIFSTPFTTLNLPYGYFHPYGIALVMENTKIKLYVSTNGSDYNQTGVIFKYELTHNIDKTSLEYIEDTEYRDITDSRLNAFTINNINKLSEIPYNPSGIVQDIDRNRVLIAGRTTSGQTAGKITFLKI